MRYIDLYDIELYKLIKERSILLLLICIALLSLFPVGLVWYDYGEYTLNGTIINPLNPYINILENINKIYAMLLPLSIVVLSARYYMVQNGKNILQCYFTPGMGFIVKSCLLMQMLFITFITAYVLFMVSIIAAKIVTPKLDLSSYDFGLPIAVMFMKFIYCGTLIAISQFAISVIFKNYYLALILGFAIVVISIFIDSDYFSLYSSRGYLSNAVSSATGYKTNFFVAEAASNAIVPILLFALAIFVERRINIHL